MLKDQERVDPSSRWNKARRDERVFILLGRDVAAPEAIRAWCRARVALQKNKGDDPQIREALDCADAMDRERGTEMPKRLGPEQVYQCTECLYETREQPVPVLCPQCYQQPTWIKLYSDLPW